MKPPSKNDQRIGLKVSKKSSQNPKKNFEKKNLRLSESLENSSIA